MAVFCDFDGVGNLEQRRSSDGTFFVENRRV